MNPSLLPARAISCDRYNFWRARIDLPLPGSPIRRMIPAILLRWLAAPLVVKLVEGTQGIGVVLAETRQAAESVIDAFRGSMPISSFRNTLPKLKDAIFVVWSSAMRLWRRLSGARKPVIFAPIFIVAGWPASRRSRLVNGISPSKPHKRWGWMWRASIFYAPRAAAGDGGECLAGTGRYRKDYGRGYRGANDSVDRTSRYA